MSRRGKKHKELGLTDRSPTYNVVSDAGDHPFDHGHEPGAEHRLAPRGVPSEGAPVKDKQADHEGAQEILRGDLVALRGEGRTRKKRRLVDLFCGAGGAAKGYVDAGFNVVGVDILPQPNYPYDFIQCDGLEFLEDWLAGRWTSRVSEHIAAFHASPPCQEFTVLRNCRKGAKPRWPNLIPQTRKLLEQTGLPWVIENVPGAPLENPIQLCGTSFGIRVRRHRLFESNMALAGLPCEHSRFTDRIFPGSSNRPNGRTVCNIGEWRVPLAVQKEVMEIDWDITLHELSEAVPPRYTQFIGLQLQQLLALDEAAAA